MDPTKIVHYTWVWNFLGDHLARKPIKTSTKNTYVAESKKTLAPKISNFIFSLVECSSTSALQWCLVNQKTFLIISKKFSELFLREKVSPTSLILQPFFPNVYLELRIGFNKDIWIPIVCSSRSTLAEPLIVLVCILWHICSHSDQENILTCTGIIWKSLSGFIRSFNGCTHTYPYEKSKYLWGSKYFQNFAMGRLFLEAFVRLFGSKSLLVHW